MNVGVLEVRGCQMVMRRILIDLLNRWSLLLFLRRNLTFLSVLLRILLQVLLRILLDLLLIISFLLVEYLILGSLPLDVGPVRWNLVLLLLRFRILYLGSPRLIMSLHFLD